MSKKRVRITLVMMTLVFISLGVGSQADEHPDATDPVDASLEQTFKADVLPFLQTTCLDCHGTETQEAKLDLSEFRSARDVAGAHQTWEILRDRIAAGEMPPADAPVQPAPEQRQAVIAWINDAREAEARRNVGDPGPVLARRLSNEEYNNSIRDLTGVDLRPTATFPVDPANEAGFDNSGESLVMSPALLKKYLDAVREVVDHLLLTPEGIAFAPHPVVTDTDRDKYCVKRIVQFYQKQPTDLATYFLAAWQYRCRQSQTKAETQSKTLEDIAAENQISPKYLRKIWSLLNNTSTSEVDAVTDPVAWVQARWQKLPDDERHLADVRVQCEHLRDDVMRLRNKVVPKFSSLIIPGNHNGSQPFVLWKNHQYAANRQAYDPKLLKTAQAPPSDPATGDKSVAEVPSDEKPAADEGELERLLVAPPEEEKRVAFETAWGQFCTVFPDVFYISERGRDYVNESQKQDGEKGRLLSAGFHSMMGYFRDDTPLYEMVLSEAEQKQLDELWLELDVIASAPMRQYVGFLWFERTDSRFMRDPQFDFARAEDRDAQTEAMIKRLGEEYLKKAIDSGGGPVEITAIEDYFREINEQIRRVEQTRAAAEPRQLEAALEFAERAYRRILSSAEREELTAFYHSLRQMDGLTHEESIQDLIVAVLMSPHFSYRLDLPGTGSDRQPLTDFELASRLSYFLWSSMPDDELIRLASVGDLHKPDVLVQQTQRMLKDARVRALATEFAGNWLDYRRFEEHNSVDRERFPEFNDELRRAMFEEPVQFFMDTVQQDRSVLELLNADHTFVNATLAKHYGMPHETSDPAAWIRIDKAGQYGRGGLLPMAVFLTKNAPGLRTSPVKRGYWVVRRLLGEHIPAPPPNVPELPNDETKLGDLTLRETLARHREHKSCSGCHNRIDSFGLVFEEFGPVGEKREVDLAGRPVETNAVFPNGQEGTGLKDLRAYLREHRQQDFVDHLSRKLLSYGLGRSLILSDELLLREISLKMTQEENRIGSLIEAIVTSPQFLMKRGNGQLADTASATDDGNQ